MDLAKREKLIAYAELKKQISELEAKAAELREDVLAIAKETVYPGEKSFELEGWGVYQIQENKVWEFTPETTATILEVESLKKDEKAKGIATFTKNDIIKFTLHA
jgi:hypothetical protein